mmetsp:Transcript_8305/g.31258  ORF Transcript_8305/g.31258 Transcript_8305/m.31258 type:complete len:250 (-) Transcript_8305:594-1343(-)
MHLRPLDAVCVPSGAGRPRQSAVLLPRGWRLLRRVDHRGGPVQHRCGPRGASAGHAGHHGTRQPLPKLHRGGRTLLQVGVSRFFPSSGGAFIVLMGRCDSGDVHTGDVVRDYEVDGSSVVQAGQKNTQAVLDWVSEQQRNGGLAAQLSELIIAGDSAGSLAAQVWAAVVADTLPATAVQVIPDSFVGVFPPAAGPIIRGFGVCGWFESETLNTKCRRGTLTQQEITLDTFERLGPDGKITPARRFAEVC